MMSLFKVKYNYKEVSSTDLWTPGRSRIILAHRGPQDALIRASSANKALRIFNNLEEVQGGWIWRIGGEIRRIKQCGYRKNGLCTFEKTHIHLSRKFKKLIPRSLQGSLKKKRCVLEKDCVCLER